MGKNDAPISLLSACLFGAVNSVLYELATDYVSISHILFFSHEEDCAKKNNEMLKWHNCISNQDIAGTFIEALDEVLQAAVLGAPIWERAKAGAINGLAVGLSLHYLLGLWKLYTVEGLTVMFNGPATEQNKHLLVNFLNTVVGNQLSGSIKEVTFLKRDLDPETVGKKQSAVDVLVEDDNGIRYVIEMQVAGGEGFEKRAIFYASKAYISQMNIGGKYQDLKEVIFLALCDFDIFPSKLDYKSEHLIVDKKTFDQDLKGMSFTFVNLPKFDNEIKLAGKKISALSLEEKWYYFLKHAEDLPLAEIETLVGQDIIIKDAFSAIDAVNWQEHELYAYEDVIKAEMDARWIKENQLASAEQKGKAEERIILAKNFLSQGVALEIVSTATGLSLAELEKLRSK